MAILDNAAVIFREGLEGVLVLATITAGLTRSNQPYQRPIGTGAVMALIAILVCWVIAVGIVNDLFRNGSALAL